MIKSLVELSFVQMCKHHGIPAPTQQHRFAKEAMGRQWQFDFCWRSYPIAYREPWSVDGRTEPLRLAVELEGLSNKISRHQTIAGFREDCVKYEAALSLGWIVYRIPAEWIMKSKGKARPPKTIWRPEVIELLVRLLV